MVSSERSGRDWYEDAARCYVERHQGCAWCGGSYRVFLQKRDRRVEYYCSGCDFRTGHDETSNQYYSIPGEDITGDVPDTMFPI
jgi:hypothetical protein